MSGLYGFASRLSGCMAGLCAVLALLALPSRSQADTLSDCQACCQSKGFTNQALSECVGNCMQGSGECAQAPNCSKGNGDCFMFEEDTCKLAFQCNKNKACGCAWAKPAGLPSSCFCFIK